MCIITQTWFEIHIQQLCILIFNFFLDIRITLVKLHASHVGNMIILLAKIRPYSRSFLNGTFFIILKNGWKNESVDFAKENNTTFFLWKIKGNLFHLYNKRNYVCSSLLWGHHIYLPYLHIYTLSLYKPTHTSLLLMLVTLDITIIFHPKLCNNSFLFLGCKTFNTNAKRNLPIFQFS
jgi:hypothetical protein